MTVVTRTLDCFLVLDDWNLISHLGLARDCTHVFAFVGVSEILRTAIAEHRISVLLLEHFLLRSKHLRVLFYDHVLLLVRGRRDELVNRELQTILQLFALFDTLN